MNAMPAVRMIIARIMGQLSGPGTRLSVKNIPKRHLAFVRKYPRAAPPPIACVQRYYPLEPPFLRERLCLRLHSR